MKTPGLTYVLIRIFIMFRFGISHWCYSLNILQNNL